MCWCSACLVQLCVLAGVGCRLMLALCSVVALGVVVFVMLQLFVLDCFACVVRVFCCSIWFA